jgi:hypothetical protein
MTGHVQMMETTAFYKIDYFEIFIVLMGLGIPLCNIKRLNFNTYFRGNLVVCAYTIVQNGLVVNQLVAKLNYSKCKYYVSNLISANLTL